MDTMKLDMLAFAAHPDDTELSCAGTLAAHIAKGYRVGVVDLTRGEMGTRGTPEIRDKEAQVSAEILQLAVRDNLGMEDGFFVNDKAHQLQVVAAIRKYRPEIVLANAIRDRHPDHGRAADLVGTSCFLAGLEKVVTTIDGALQKAWRPKALYHYVQSEYIKPDIVVDVSEHWEKKMAAIAAFKSQFHNPDSEEPETFISSPEFMILIEARGKDLGHTIGVRYGEGFTVRRLPAVSDLFDLI